MHTGLHLLEITLLNFVLATFNIFLIAIEYTIVIQNHSFVFGQFATKIANRIHATMEENAMLVAKSTTSSVTFRQCTATALLATLANTVKASTTNCFF